MTEQFEFHVAMLEEVGHDMKDLCRTRCWSHKRRLPPFVISREVVDVLEDVKEKVQQKETVGEPVPCVTKEILEEIKDLPQERICERTGEQVDDNLLQRVTKEILEKHKTRHETCGSGRHMCTAARKLA